eukprot:2785372-Lingulodinium_polyedra.AAC.1
MAMCSLIAGSLAGCPPSLLMLLAKQATANRRADLTRRCVGGLRGQSPKRRRRRKRGRGVGVENCTVEIGL